MTTSIPSQGWSAAPSHIRSLFKIFPLRTHAAEPLPARSPDPTRHEAQLFIFSSADAASHGLPSFNPTCLKWQTYLHIASVPFVIIPSNNHASPSGSLPYLLPVSTDSRPDLPLTGAQIGQYAQKHSALIPSAPNPREETYRALITQSIRPAWLHALYLCPAHTEFLSTLYLPSTILRAAHLHDLRSAAANEILKATRRPLVLPDQIYADAKSAFAALSALLADDAWFFGADQPGLFDADIFAYTFLMLDASPVPWRDVSLRICVADCENLVRHQRRLYERCWPNTRGTVM